MSTSGTIKAIKVELNVNHSKDLVRKGKTEVTLPDGTKREVTLQTLLTDPRVKLQKTEKLVKEFDKFLGNRLVADGKKQGRYPTSLETLDPAKYTPVKQEIKSALNNQDIFVAKVSDKTLEAAGVKKEDLEAKAEEFKQAYTAINSQFKAQMKRDLMATGVDISGLSNKELQDAYSAGLNPAVTLAKTSPFEVFNATDKAMIQNAIEGNDKAVKVQEKIANSFDKLATKIEAGKGNGDLEETAGTIRKELEKLSESKRCLVLSVLSDAHKDILANPTVWAKVSKAIPKGSHPEMFVISVKGVKNKKGHRVYFRSVNDDKAIRLPGLHDKRGIPGVQNDKKTKWTLIVPNTRGLLAKQDFKVQVGHSKDKNEEGKSIRSKTINFSKGEVTLQRQKK